MLYLQQVKKNNEKKIAEFKKQFEHKNMQLLDQLQINTFES